MIWRIGVRPIHNFHGNMLIMVGLCSFLLVLVITFWLGVEYFFFSNKNLQFNVDQFAIAAAVNLNYNDCIGQMNNLLANSRELVFNSRNTYTTTVANAPLFTNLANRFLMESRDGADMVIKGRQQLLTLILSNVQDRLESANTSGDFGQQVCLGFAQSGIPKITNLRLGNIQGVESNVLGPYGNAPLLALDTKSDYLDTTSHLYYGNCALSLPQDSDKIFFIASLPAPVNGNVAPLKLTSAQTFQFSIELLNSGTGSATQQSPSVSPAIASSTSQQLPSAVQAVVQMDVKLSNFGIDNQITVESTAATNGASPVTP